MPPIPAGMERQDPSATPPATAAEHYPRAAVRIKKEVGQLKPPPGHLTSNSHRQQGWWQGCCVSNDGRPAFCCSSHRQAGKEADGSHVDARRGGGEEELEGGSGALSSPRTSYPISGHPYGHCSGMSVRHCRHQGAWPPSGQ